MKNIQVVKENKEPKIFGIKGYSFIEVESNLPPIPIYRIAIKQHFDSQLDFRYWFEEISSNIQFLTETPEELTDYIKRYEENIRFMDKYLFHDLRTRYIDFQLYDEEGLKNNVLLVGYTILEEETCLAIKAFSLDGLAEFTHKVLDYCIKNDIAVESENNLRWIQLEQIMLSEINPNRNDIFDAFLQKTLQPDYCGIFIKAFKIIDSQGYLDKSFYDTPVSINGNEIEVRKVKQFTKYFSPFWKTEISIKEASRTVLYLHDELLNDESIDKTVYTIKPHLMQYYQLHWFEDFCSEVIRNIVVPEFKVVNSYSGRRFDFFQNGKEDDIREIDLILGIKYNNDYKIIAVECKKTLTDKEITTTNKKIKNKILKSHSNIIDAYIHIGCFNNGVEFNKIIVETHENYKQGRIQIESDPRVNDVPYFAFSISSIDNLQLKICHVIKEIFEQW
jgi:hypothetical protein